MFLVKNAARREPLRIGRLLKFGIKQNRRRVINIYLEIPLASRNRIARVLSGYQKATQGEIVCRRLILSWDDVPKPRLLACQGVPRSRAVDLVALYLTCNYKGEQSDLLQYLKGSLCLKTS
jgi:hypothetical protein